MKNSGIVRTIDSLGRLSIPISIRRCLSIDAGTPLSLRMEGENIIITKHKDEYCVFCGETIGLIPFKDQYLCESCARELKLQEI